MPDVLATAFTPGVGYPYSSGYSRVEDVAARINAGSWDPTKPTAFPTVAQVNAWLIEATATIDSALATRGYYVPLAPAVGWVPPTGMPTYLGVGLGAWLMLRNIAAAYAASFVESARHGSIGQNMDTNADRWGAVYGNLLQVIEDGTDNLGAFGCGGPFAPEIDPAKGVVSGSMGFSLSSGEAQQAMFTRGMQLGSGTELTSGGLGGADTD